MLLRGCADIGPREVDVTLGVMCTWRQHSFTHAHKHTYQSKIESLCMGDFLRRTHRQHQRFFSFAVTETVTHIVGLSIDASARRTHLTPHIRPGGLTSCVTLHMGDDNEIRAWQENVQLLHTVEVKLLYQICGHLISIIRVLFLGMVDQVIVVNFHYQDNQEYPHISQCKKMSCSLTCSHKLISWFILSCPSLYPCLKP